MKAHTCSPEATGIVVVWFIWMISRCCRLEFGSGGKYSMHEVELSVVAIETSSRAFSSDAVRDAFDVFLSLE